MIPKSRDIWITGIEADHFNSILNIHVPMLTQMQRISRGLEMIPFTTISIVLVYALKTRTFLLLGIQKNPITRSLRKGLRRQCAL